MLKLLKYEFRKALASFLTLIGITIAVEVYYLVSLKTDAQDHVVIAVAMLMVLSFATAAFVFIRGVVSYSGELRSKTSYLLFLIPKSTNQILASKYLYTFVNGLLFLVLYGALAGLDIALMKIRYGQYESMYELVRNLLSQYGVYIDSMLIGTLFVLLFGFLLLLSFIGIAYFSVTLSHTLLRDKKWRWLVAVVFFLVLSRLVMYICSLFPSMLDSLVMVDPLGTKEVTHTEMSTLQQLITYLMPSLLVNAAVVVGTLFGSASMLKYKVSL